MTLTKIDQKWLRTIGIEEAFRQGRVITRFNLKDMFGKTYTVETVKMMINLRRKEDEEDKEEREMRGY